MKGIHNLKAGVTYEQTFLTENDSFGIVDPTFNAPCLNADGSLTVAGLTIPQRESAGFSPMSPRIRLRGSRITARCPTWLPTTSHAAALFAFNGHTDVKELALYVQDTITNGNWSFNLGLRGDLYNGLDRPQRS